MSKQKRERTVRDEEQTFATPGGRCPALPLFTYLHPHFTYTLRERERLLEVHVPAAEEYADRPKLALSSSCAGVVRLLAAISTVTTQNKSLDMLWRALIEIVILSGSIDSFTCIIS